MRRRNPVKTRRVSPETARRIVSAQKRAKAEPKIRLAGTADQALLRPAPVKRARKPRPTDWVPEAISDSQTATGKSTAYMQVRKRAEPVTSRTIRPGDQATAEATIRREAWTRGLRSVIATIEEGRRNP